MPLTNREVKVFRCSSSNLKNETHVGTRTLMTMFIASSTQNVKSHNECIKWWADKIIHTMNSIQ